MGGGRWAELDAHAVILAHLFRLVETGVVATPLQQENPALSNTAFVQQYIMKIIFEAFPHLQEYGWPLAADRAGGRAGCLCMGP